MCSFGTQTASFLSHSNSFAQHTYTAQGEYAAVRRVYVLCNSPRGFLFIYKLRRTSAGRTGKKRLPALSRSLIVCGNNDHSRTALLCPAHTHTHTHRSFALAAGCGVACTLWLWGRESIKIHSTRTHMTFKTYPDVTCFWTKVN